MVAIDPMAHMTMEVTLDGLVEDLVRMKAFHRDAHQAATLVMAETYVKIIDRFFAKHHDTNRYINGYISALRDIGLDSIPLKPYKRSDRHDQWVDKLKKQYEAQKAIANRLRKWLALGKARDINAKPRRDGKPRKKVVDRPSYKKLLRKLKQAEKREERALEELIAAINNESVLFVHGRKGRMLKSGKLGKSRLTTTRVNPYGGSGSLTLLGSQVIVELHNLEPHSRIIETRPGYGFPHKTAMNRLKVLGVKKVSRRYVERQAELMNRRIVSPSEIRAHNAKRHTILFPDAA